MNDDYQSDPIRRWVQRQQNEKWLEVKLVIGGLIAVPVITYIIYLLDVPL